MKRIVLVVNLLLLLLLPTQLLRSVAAAEDTGMFTVVKMVTSLDVIEREPVGMRDTFELADNKVFCFLEAREITDDFEVYFVWSHEGTELDSVPVTLKKGPRWRTYSSKKLGNRSGKWRIEIRDANGVVMDSRDFTVE